MNTKDAGSSETRMDKVRDALLMRSVQEAFFPDDPTVTNHVLVYTFTSGPPAIGRVTPCIVEQARLQNLIQENLSVQGTHICIMR